jgi:hypothetical protein
MKKLIYILAFVTTITSCEKLDYNSQEYYPNLEGTYSGTFSILNDEKLLVENAEIVLKNGKYTVTKANVGTGATGSFNFSENNVINFYDTKNWQQVIDMNLILNNRYKYETKEDSLILTKDFPLPVVLSKPYFYQYRLKRIAN